MDDTLSVTRWSPDPEPCDACGAESARRWRAEAGFVCPDCVDWGARGL